MTGPRGPSAPGPKLLGTTRSKIRIAFASVAILVVGVLATPVRRPTPLPPSQERAAPLIDAHVQTRAQARALPDVADLTARLRATTVAVLAGPPPHPPLVDDMRGPVPDSPAASGSGVIVSPSEVLTYVDALGGRSTVTVSFVDGRTAEARVAAFEPDTGLTLLAVSSGETPPALATDIPAAGSPGVAIGGAVAAPIFVVRADQARVDISGLPARTAAGAGLFTVTGELFGIAGRDDTGIVGLMAAITRLRESAAAKQGAIGLSLQALTPALAAAIGVDAGALIVAAVPDGPAADAGLVAGDVIRSAGSTVIQRLGDAESILRSTTIDVPLELTITRANRSQTVSVIPRSPFEVAALHRAAAAVSPEGPEARLVFAADVLAAAGVPPRSRVLAVNGRTILTRADARRRSVVARPTLLRLWHEGRAFFAVLRPSVP